MDQFNQNPPYTPPQNTGPTPPSAPQSEGGAGALIGSIIVILVLVAGAIYFYGRELNKDQDVQDESPQTEESQLEADLEAENLDNLDSEFNSDLEAEYQ